MCAYKISSFNQILNIIIPHFEKYNLITKKQADFLLFKEILKLIKQERPAESDIHAALLKKIAAANAVLIVQQLSDYPGHGICKMMY